MIRTLLATTAVAAILALPVFAQDASSSMESSAMSSMESSSAMDSSMMSSEAPMDSSAMSSEMPMDSSSMTDSSIMSSEMPMDSSSAMSSMETTGPFDIVTGYTQIDSDRFATRIIGQPVYDGTATDANMLGNINDLVIDETGNVIAVTIGVGGFLGIGEKQVAVAYSALSREIAADNTERFVVATTVEELTAAPDFVVTDATPADGTAPAATDTMATSSVAP
jgi:hypothetical protein